MTTFSRWFPLRLNQEPLDASLSYWGCILGGLGICGMALLSLRRYAMSERELLLGITLSILDCALLFLLGALGRQVHLAIWMGKAPWRLRRGELLAHAVGLVVLTFGGWTLMLISAGVAGTITVALSFLALYTAILCLGTWSTLARRGCASR